MTRLEAYPFNIEKLINGEGFKRGEMYRKSGIYLFGSTHHELNENLELKELGKISEWYGVFTNYKGSKIVLANPQTPPVVYRIKGQECVRTEDGQNIWEGDVLLKDTEPLSKFSSRLSVDYIIDRIKDNYDVRFE